MAAQEMISADDDTPQIMAACNPGVLSEEIQGEIIAALESCGSKVLHRDAEGNYEETHLAQGLDPCAIHGTRCFFNLEYVKPRLRDLLLPPQMQQNVVDRVNLYMSPPGTGAPMHFDIRTVIIVQLHGRKLWQVAKEPAVKDPTRNTVVMEEESDIAWYGDERLHLPDHMYFIVLEPGDWLLVPSGTWHGTYSEQGSISATLAFPGNDQAWRQLDHTKVNTHKLPLGRRLSC